MNGVDMIGAAAGAVGALMIVPQAWRVWTRRDPEGISATTYSVAAAMSVIWFGYGWITHREVMIVTNIPLGIAAVLVLLGIFACDRSQVSRWTTAPIVVAAVTVLAVDKIGAPVLLAALGMSASLGFRIPQVRKAWVTDTVSGVSSATWRLSMLSQVLWFCWAAAVAEPLVMMSAVSAAVLSGLIIYAVNHTSPVAVHPL